MKSSFSSAFSVPLWFIALLLLFYALTLPHITRTMQYDEAYTLRYFAISPVRALFSYTDPNNHFLHSFAVWLMRSIGGESVVTARFPAFAFALLSLAMLYRFSGRIADRSVGIAAAAILAGTFAFADYAINARGYTLSIFLSLALIDLLFVGKARPTRVRRYLTIFLSAALIITLPSMIVLIAAAFVWCFWNMRQKRRGYSAFLIPLIMGVFIGGLFYLPSLAAGEIAEQLARFGSTPVETLAEWFGLILSSPLAIGVLGLAVLGALIAPRRLWQITLFVIGTALVLLLMQFILTGKTFFGRNYIYLLPIIFLFSAVTIAYIFKRYTPVFSLIALLLIGLISFSQLSRPTDVDRVLAAIHENLGEGDTILMGCCVEEPVMYHLLLENQPRLVIPNDQMQTLYLLPTEFNAIENLLALYGYTDRVENCTPVETWSIPGVVRCDVLDVVD
jgi:hypothetical protein